MTVQLYRGDCLEILPTLEAGSVDAVVTDPPYGIDFKYATHDDNPDAYGDSMREFIGKAQRVVGNGPILMWQAMLNCAKWHEWFPPEFRIFAACKGFVQYRPTPIQYSWDPIIFWGNINVTPSVYKKDYHEQRRAPFGKNRESIDHPCPRPLEQCLYIIDTFTRPGDTVLDAFLGSGTVGIAAVMLGRNFIGIEISEQYFRVAERRIAEAQMQMRLGI